MVVASPALIDTFDGLARQAAAALGASLHRCLVSGCRK